MSTHGLRLLVLLVGAPSLAGLLGLAGGCASVPPVPEHVRTRPPGATPASGRNHDEDEYDGWLFRSMTGGRTAAAPQQPPPAAVAAPSVERLPPTASAVVPASYEQPAPSRSYEPTTRKKQDDSGFGIGDLAPDKVVANIKAVAGYGPDEAKARAALQQGKLLFQQKRYDEAAKQFKSAASRWHPESILEEDALFYLAESQFFADRYPKAQDTYGQLQKNHGNSRYLDTVSRRLFAIGQYWEGLHKKNPHWPITPNLTDSDRPRFDTLGRAIKAYEMVSIGDPTGPLADDAVMAVAVAHASAGHWEEAAYQFDLLRKEYPKSEHQAQAHLRGLRARMEVYQGPAYDNTPLLKADEIAEQTLVQFPTELGDQQRNSVLKERDRILEQRAARDWLYAEFYDTKHQYGAARYYYRSVVENYPLTSYAQRARQRLGEIQGEPDNPPKNFKWLTDMFPSDAE